MWHVDKEWPEEARGSSFQAHMPNAGKSVSPALLDFPNREIALTENVEVLAQVSE